MKRFKVILAVSLVFLMMFLLSVSCLAMSTGFSVEDFSEEELVRLKKHIIINTLDEEPAKQPFQWFAVNDKNQIAIGYDGLEDKTICVYNADGEFQYGFEFESSEWIYIEWGNDNLNILFVRCCALVSVDSKGNIVEIKEVQDTIENNSYQNNTLSSNQKSVNGTTYSAENVIDILTYISPTYSKIISVDSSGVECVIFDASSKQLVETISFLVIVLLFFTIIPVLLAVKIVRSKKISRDQSGDGSMIDKQSRDGSVIEN